MNPTIAKYRERLGLQKPDGMPYFSVHRDDLAALLDIAEACAGYDELDRQCAILAMSDAGSTRCGMAERVLLEEKMHIKRIALVDALARLNGAKP